MLPPAAGGTRHTLCLHAGLLLQAEGGAGLLRGHPGHHRRGRHRPEALRDADEAAGGEGTRPALHRPRRHHRLQPRGIPSGRGCTPGRAHPPAAGRGGGRRRQHDVERQAHPHHHGRREPLWRRRHRPPAARRGGGEYQGIQQGIQVQRAHGQGRRRRGYGAGPDHQARIPRPLVRRRGRHPPDTRALQRRLPHEPPLQDRPRDGECQRQQHGY